MHYIWWPWYSCILSFLLRTWDRLQIICQYEKYLEQLLNGFIIAHQIWPTSEDHCWNYRVITHHILLDLFFVWCYSICSVSICFFGGFLLKKIVMGLWILVIGLVQNLVVHFSEYSFDFSLITIEKWSISFIFNFFLSMTFLFVKIIKWNGKSCIFQQKIEHIRHFLSAGGDYIWISRCLFIYVLLLNDVERTKSHVCCM